MRHKKHRHQLGRTKEHRLALLENLATSLFEHGRIRTTLAKAKALRPFAEKLITKAKRAHTLPQEKAVHQIRIVARKLRGGRKKREITQVLFGDIARRFQTRPGGYTRIIKLGPQRLGDGAEMALIELVQEEYRPQAPKGRGRVYKGNEIRAPETVIVTAGEPAATTLERRSTAVSRRQRFKVSGSDRLSAMSYPQELPDGNELQQFAYPVPKLFYNGVEKPVQFQVGQPITVEVRFERAFKKLTRKSAHDQGVTGVKKVGAALDIPESIAIEDSIYKEVGFPDAGVAPAVSFKLVPKERGSVSAKVHFFDQADYRGTSVLEFSIV